MNWSLFRMIIPAFPEINIFTRQAKKTTALGPIMVATVANKLWAWRVEVIDENNYKGTCDTKGLPDHAILQKQNPAQVVGFYCGLTSTMERVWEIARFYHQEKVITIAGGWHAHYCPEETLRHDIDLVVHGDGESSVRKILTSIKREEPLNDIFGTSFLEQGELKTNLPEFLEEPDLNGLPYPDFSLLKYARIRIYPISRTRGCSMNCEFCGVKGASRWASAQHLFDTVNWLVETKKARHFFIVDDRIVDDRSEQDLDRTIEFFNLIARKYGNRLHFTVQARLETAKKTKLLEVMRDAGVRIVCIGYESPIDEDLKAMRKGFLSSNMLGWTRIWHRYIRWIHAMFIVGYPSKEKKNSISAKETIKRFKKFINKAFLDTVQILLPGPGPGTDLRQRLEKEGRIFPLDLVPWNKYDGSYVCFRPDNMSVRELQEIPAKLMSRFYNPLSFIRIPLRIIAFPIDFFVRGWGGWYRGWYRDIVRYGGHLLLQKWRKKRKDSEFIEKLENY